MEKEQALWNHVKQQIQEKYEPSVFNETFENITTVHKVVNNYIYIVVANALIKYRVERFYLKSMDDMLRSITGENIGFKLITKDDAEKENEAKNNQPLLTPNFSETVRIRNLRPDYTFDNFVTGEANREAFTFALKVADSPHVTVNPFYIFGDVGLGKTHLMMSIGHYILSNNINANIVYTTAQQFVEDFFNAKSKNQKNPDAAKNFNDYYRSADVFLVDDIQLLSGKTGSQEEFFKLFEDLFENNKQIVITSDRPAKELDLMDRLKSRFNWGIPVDIKKPNSDLRKLILRKKLSFLISDPSVVPDEVLDYISECFDENVRELEGALRRYVTYCVSFNYDFTLQNAKESLESIIDKTKNNNIETSSVITEKIKNVVSSYFNINVKDLSSSSRKQELVYARNIAIYLMRSLFNLPLKTIGEAFGGKDHATVSHSIDKITKQLAIDNSIKQDIDFLTSKIQ